MHVCASCGWLLPENSTDTLCFACAYSMVCRYRCLSCRFSTNDRVEIKDHAAVLGHQGWTDSEHPPRPLCFHCGPGYRVGDEGCSHT